MLTRCTTLCAVALCSFAGSASAAALPMPLVSVLPESVAQPDQPQVACLVGFSKDYCNGSVTPLELSQFNCITPIPEGTCRGVKLAGAFNINLFSSTLGCGSTNPGTCDETINGQLAVRSTFLIRLQESCPYRGCWSGSATFAGSDHSVYTGTLMGTLGVGTHRSIGPVSFCAQNGRACERCYDVEFNPQSGLWRIGFEATFQGRRADQPTGQELCFSLSGDFFIPGTAAGGPIWDSNAWRVNGTADGIHLTFCP